MKNGISIFVFGLMIIMISGCTSIPLGDGGSLKIKEDGLTLQSSDENEALDISIQEGEMVITGTDDKGEEFQQKISTDQKLPVEFPSEIPIPPNEELTVIESKIGEKMQIIVRYSVKGTVIESYKLYREYIEQAGYENIIDASEGDAAEDTVMENIMANSDDKTLTIGITKSGTGEYDDGTVTVSIMYMYE